MRFPQTEAYLDEVEGGADCESDAGKFTQEQGERSHRVDGGNSQGVVENHHEGSARRLTETVPVDRCKTKQEIIPVGCVLTAAVACTPGEGVYVGPVLPWTYPTPGIPLSIPYPLDRTWYQGYQPPTRVDRETPVKTLPSCNFVGSRYQR